MSGGLSRAMERALVRLYREAQKSSSTDVVGAHSGGISKTTLYALEERSLIEYDHYMGKVRLTRPRGVQAAKSVLSLVD